MASSCGSFSPMKPHRGSFHAHRHPCRTLPYSSIRHDHPFYVGGLCWPREAGAVGGTLWDITTTRRLHSRSEVLRSPLADHVAFAGSGPGFGILYLGCQGESLGPEFRVVQTDGREDWKWKVGSSYSGGTTELTNIYVMYSVSRNRGEAFRHEDELPPEEESHLDITGGRV